MLKNKSFLRTLMLSIALIMSIGIFANTYDVAAKTVVQYNYDSKNRVIKQSFVDDKNTSSTKDDKVLYYYQFSYNSNDTIKMAKKVQNGKVVCEYYYKTGTKYGNHGKRIAYQYNIYYNANNTIKYEKKIQNGKTVAIYYYSAGAKYGNQGTKITYIDYYKNGKKTNTVYKTKAAKQNAIIKYAKTLNGSKYRAGGTTPSGFDCSGFTGYVYKQVLSQDLGRATYNQTKKGSYVSLNNLQPGDILFWGSKNAPYHVGIYLGNGKYIHAEDYNKGVNIKTFNYFKPSYAKRMI